MKTLNPNPSLLCPLYSAQFDNPVFNSDKTPLSYIVSVSRMQCR